MRCKHCDYPLWTIETRTCPECGEGFRPSEFEFPPGAVAFQCPHCRQSYYGTAADGHLEPEAFDCVRCGRSIHMDEMVLLPAERHTEVSASTPMNPWTERDRIGLIRAWWRSVRDVLTVPTSFGRSIRNNEPVSESILFLLWISGVTAAVTTLFSAASLLFLFTLAGSAGGSMPFSRGFLLIQQVAAMVLVLVVSVGLTIVISFACHLMLRLLRGAFFST